MRTKETLNRLRGSLRWAHMSAGTFSQIPSNLNGHWGLIMAPVQEGNSDNLGKSIFYTTIVCWVYSLESPRWCDSNEYTQHTIPWQNKKKILNICFLELLEEFCRDWKKSSNHPRWTSHPCLSHWSYTVCSLYNTVKVYLYVVCHGVKNKLPSCMFHPSIGKLFYMGRAM